MPGENAPRLTAVPVYAQHQQPLHRPPSSPPLAQQHHHHQQHPQLQLQHPQHHPQQQQQHPHQQHSPLTQLSPSTVKASPQQTPGPLDAGSGSAEPSAKRGMRSQIACARCRRSKTKCENAGQGTTCKACANTKRDCIWDHAAVPTASAPPRRDSTADFDVSFMPCVHWALYPLHNNPHATPRPPPARNPALALTSPGPAQEAP